MNMTLAGMLYEDLARKAEAYSALRLELARQQGRVKASERALKVAEAFVAKKLDAIGPGKGPAPATTKDSPGTKLTESESE